MLIGGVTLFKVDGTHSVGHVFILVFIFIICGSLCINVRLLG